MFVLAGGVMAMATPLPLPAAAPHGDLAALSLARNGLAARAASPLGPRGAVESEDLFRCALVSAPPADAPPPGLGCAPATVRQSGDAGLLETRGRPSAGAWAQRPPSRVGRRRRGSGVFRQTSWEGARCSSLVAGAESSADATHLGGRRSVGWPTDTRTAGRHSQPPPPFLP